MPAEIVWYVVVRHGPRALMDATGHWIDPNSGEVCFYPPEGFPISAFADKAQAEGFATASTTPREVYEAITVSPVPRLT